MAPKKNPSKDLNRKSGLYFVIGLMLVLLMAFIALEWKTYDDGHDYDLSLNVEDDINEDVPITVHFKNPPPPPPVQAPPVIDVREDDDDVVEDVIASSESNEDKEVIEVQDVEFDEVEEDVDVNWISIEEVPVFPGCENAEDKRACFQKMMNKHIRKVFRYPEMAQEMGTEGKVFTQFVIEKDGSIGDIRLRGPDKMLEAEAERIIGELPKMTPGKQRDQNVKVAFSIPIVFQLQ